MTDNFVLCRSDKGDGGWSLHPPESTDEEIGCGDAPYLIAGEAKKIDGRWDRPNATDYAVAAIEWQSRQARQSR